MPPPALILAVLQVHRPEFTARTRARVVALLTGTIPARGRRTVAAALREMGLHDDPNFSSYHRVFNRAAWSPPRLARRLLRAAIAAFVPEGVGLSFAIDETLEWRRGRPDPQRGPHPDPPRPGQKGSGAPRGIPRHAPRPGV